MSEEQAEVFWDEHRNILMAGGEGASKSFTGALRALLFSLTDPNTRLVWLIGADFDDARKELDYIIEFATLLGVMDRSTSTVSTHTDQKCRVHIKAPGTRFEPPIDFYVETISGYDPLKIGREEPDVVIGCEVSRWPAELWHRAQGRLARRYPNSWGLFSGSFETSLGWFPEIFQLGQGPNDQDLISFSVPSWANRVLYPGGANDPAILKLQNSMSAERFLARHAGKPAPPRDAVLPEFKASLHIHPVEYVSNYPVYVFIDPGTHIYAVEFVQVVGDEIHVIDEVFMAHANHEAVVNTAMNKGAWRWVREGTIDVAGKQHHFGFGSPEEAWFRDTGLSLRAAYHPVDRTVERLRSALMVNPVTQRPRLLINPRCKGLIAELGGGSGPVDGVSLWRMSTGGTPSPHNCDALKALGYGLLSLYGTTKPAQNEEFEGYEDDDGGTYLGRPRAANLSDLLRRARA